MRTQYIKHTVVMLWLTLAGLALQGGEKTPVMRPPHQWPAYVAEIQAAIEAEKQLPPATTNLVPDITGLDLDGLARKWGCSLKRSLLETNEVCSVESIFFDFLPTTNTSRYAFHLVLIVGRKDALDARRRLFQYMGASSSMDAFPGRWRFYDEGPGDFCLVGGSRLQNGAGTPTVTRNLQFVRNNVAVYLMGMGEINLVPVARDLDDAIKHLP